MAFKSLFLAHAPDADYEKHNHVIDTGKSRLFTVLVKDQAEALHVAKSMYENEKIDAIILCPGFTHSDVAELFNSLGGKVSINVARGDGPSNKIVLPVLQREFFNE